MPCTQALVTKFNPTAKLVEATMGRVDPKEILGTGLFDMKAAAQHPEWLKEARIGEHMPETEEFGISSIVFKSRRPLSPKRSLRPSHPRRSRHQTGVRLHGQMG